jgi:hypothetical protein
MHHLFASACGNRITLRIADGARRAPCPKIDFMSSSLGFWSLDPHDGVLTCCPKATAILGISHGHSIMLRDVLLRLHAADRRRLLRAGVASLKARSVFDIAPIRMSGGHRPLRVIGGLGYEMARGDAQIHGVVEQPES